MAQVVIADAGPLIALAKVDLLAILQQMFGNVVIPDAGYRISKDILKQIRGNL